MRLIKEKEDLFFRLMQEDMALIAETAKAYCDLMNDYTNVEAKTLKIKELETLCDNKVHEITAELNKAFITPFDREDIYQIIQMMDDIADTVEKASSWYYIYNIDELRSGAVEMAGVLEKIIAKLVELFDALPKFKKTTRIKELCIEIHALENENDDIYRRCLYHLFRDDDVSTLDIIKWKQLYQLIEDAVDACSHLAQFTEGTVMKHV